MLSRGQPCSNRPETRSREIFRILQFEDTSFFLTNFSRHSIKRPIITFIFIFNFYLLVYFLFICFQFFLFVIILSRIHFIYYEKEKLSRKTHGMTVSTSVTGGYKSLRTLSIRSFLFIYIYIYSIMYIALVTQ